MEKVYLNELWKPKTKHVTDALTEISGKTANISKTCKRQIEVMRKVFESGNYEDATTRKLTKYIDYVKRAERSQTRD